MSDRRTNAIEQLHERLAFSVVERLHESVVGREEGRIDALEYPQPGRGDATDHLAAIGRACYSRHEPAPHELVDEPRDAR